MNLNRFLDLTGNDIVFVLMSMTIFLAENVGRSIPFEYPTEDSRIQINPQKTVDQRYASPSAFRARSPHHRDSLKNRYSPGRPGSRRHQRWANETAMREQVNLF
jgi:hypothetical protein